MGKIRQFRRRDPKADPGIPPRDLKDIRNFALPTGDVVHCGKPLPDLISQ